MKALTKGKRGSLRPDEMYVYESFHSVPLMCLLFLVFVNEVTDDVYSPPPPRGQHQTQDSPYVVTVK